MGPRRFSTVGITIFLILLALPTSSHGNASPATAAFPRSPSLTSKSLSSPLPFNELNKDLNEDLNDNLNEDLNDNNDNEDYEPIIILCDSKHSSTHMHYATKYTPRPRRRRKVQHDVLQSTSSTSSSTSSSSFRSTSSSTSSSASSCTPLLLSLLRGGAAPQTQQKQQTQTLSPSAPQTAVSNNTLTIIESQLSSPSLSSAPPSNFTLPSSSSLLLLPASDQAPPEGYEWDGKWKIVVGSDCDKYGWRTSPVPAKHRNRSARKVREGKV